MKKLLALLLTLLALTVVFAACSCGGDGETTDTTAATDPVTEPVTEPVTDPVTESTSDIQPAGELPLVAEFETRNEKVYAFPNNDGVYNKGNYVNYYSAPALIFDLGNPEVVKLQAGSYADGTELTRVGIYFQDEAKVHGWSKIAIDGGKFVYVRNSVLTTDPNYAETTAAPETQPKPQIEVVADAQFTVVNEQVVAYSRSDADVYSAGGPVRYYSAPAANKDDRADLLAGDFTDGTTLTRVGIYVENPEDPEKNGWSKISVTTEEGEKFVYMRNWVLLTPEEYAAKTKAN